MFLRRLRPSLVPSTLPLLTFKTSSAMSLSQLYHSTSDRKSDYSDTFKGREHMEEAKFMKIKEHEELENLRELKREKNLKLAKDELKRILDDTDEKLSDIVMHKLAVWAIHHGKSSAEREIYGDSISVEEVKKTKIENESADWKIA